MYVFTRFTFSLCCVQNPITLVVFPVKNNWSTKIAYKSLVMLYYHPILDSIFLSTCFLSVTTFLYFYFYLHLINRGQRVGIYE